MCLSLVQTALSPVYCVTEKWSYSCSMKNHKVIPIFKSDDPRLAKNYYSTSVLSHTSKVLERLIFNKIISHISSTISLCQYGFMENSSTLQQILVFLNYIVENPKN